MKLKSIMIGLAISTLCLSTSLYGQEPELLFVTKLPGNQTDLSGLEGKLSDESPHNLFGGISGLCYTETGHLLAVADRGPKDGAVEWHCRYHVLQLNTKTKTVELQKTVLLFDEKNRPFLGRSTNYQPSEKIAHRFDPEGIVLLPNGNVTISDEYGPHVIEFKDGRAQARVEVAAKLLVKNPGPDKATENKNNTTGRSGNRGMEGLTTIDDGKRFVGLMQSSLLQDSKFNAKGKPIGRHARIWQQGSDSEPAREFVYTMEGPKHKLHEIVSLNDNEFLVLENDGEVGAESKYKRVYRIDTRGASDVSQVAKLDPETLPTSIKPVKKELVVDLLDSVYGLQSTIPEKVEGLALGPIVDGRQTLIVATDNDFEMENATRFYVFALPRTPVVTE